MAHRDFAAIFGQILRERRLAKGISQDGLADKADVHRTHISLIERGRRSPSLDVARKIAIGLGERLFVLVQEAEERFDG